MRRGAPRTHSRSRGASQLSPVMSGARAEYVRCSGDPAAPEHCTGGVTVQVGPGTTPEFSWSPVCAGSELTVTDPANRLTWVIAVPGEENRLAPPVRYGSVPEGTQTLQSAVPLSIDLTYVVRVYWIDRSDDRVLLQLAGEASFRP